MWRYKKRWLEYYWVDYIRAKIEFPKKHQLFTLSSNSNQCFLDYEWSKISITRLPLSCWNWYFSITVDNINIGFLGCNAKGRSDFIEMTWQWLTIFWENIFYFLMKKLKLEFIKFKRIDICFDLNLQINYFFDKILLKKYKEKDEKWNYLNSMTPIITKKNGVETIYFGIRDNRKNKYILNRIYNKILDSSWFKDKLWLYSHYKNEDWTYKDITRFETELRSDICEYYPYDCLRDDNFLFFRLVKSFYKYNWQFFKFLHSDDFFKFKKTYNKKNKNIISKILTWNFNKIESASQKRLKVSIDRKIKQQHYGNDFISPSEEEKTITMFLSYANRLYGNWYNITKLNSLLINFFDEKDLFKG